MSKEKVKREVFDPKNIPVEGSLGLLALGDVGFEAWRKTKEKHNRKIIDERRAKKKK